MLAFSFEGCLVFGTAKSSLCGEVEHNAGALGSKRLCEGAGRVK